MDVLEQARETVKTAMGNCHEHPGSAPSESTWKLVIAARAWCSCRLSEGQCDSYCDTDSCALIALDSGEFMVAQESSDTSGHGCQCDGSITIHPDLETALRFGLTDTDKEMMKLS